MTTDKKANKRLYAPNPEINKKVSIWKGDSTMLEIDAIVNAANSSLLGGGGIDGAIHSAAGSKLRKECATLNGCNTGFTKITKGYRLPAKHVLHTVGPTEEDPIALQSCYSTTLQLVEKYNLKSVAFCCVATGIFGYPLRNASKIALKTIREWLEANENYKKVDRLIFVVFLDKEQKCYESLMPKYFPLPLTPEEIANEEEEKKMPLSSSSEDESPKNYYSNWRSWQMNSFSYNQQPRITVSSSAFTSAAQLLEERREEDKKDERED